MTSTRAETFQWILNLKESFLRAAIRKNETKLRKTEKTWKKEKSPIKETLAQVFPCEFCEISKNTFFDRTLPDGCFWVVTVMMRKKGDQYKLKRISNSDWCVYSAKQSLTDVLRDRCQAYRRFTIKFTKF